jgi:biopolymer transport protein ExbD
MSEIIQNNPSNRSSKLPKVILDMTPMVDMAFLLLTFFVLAATLNKPKAVEIIYPQESSIKTTIHNRNVVTVLLGHQKHQVYYYPGKFKPDSTALQKTSSSVLGLGQVLLERNSGLLVELSNLRQDFERGKLSDELYRIQYQGILSTHESLMVLIKTCADTPYESVISVMDQLSLAEVKRRSIQKMTPDESSALEKVIADHTEE